MSLHPRTRDPALLPARDKRSNKLIGTRVKSSLVTGLTVISAFCINYSALAADLSVEPTSHDFGSVNINASSQEKNFTVLNMGSSLQLGTIDELGNTSTAQSTAFHITADECSNQNMGTIPSPSATCELAVIFEPLSVGPNALDLFIPYSDELGNATSLRLPLTGTGVDIPVPDIGASLESHDFGEVNVGSASEIRQIRFFNTGEADLQIDNVTMSGDSDMVLLANFDLCSGTVVSPSQYCSVITQFSPQSGGDKIATLSVTSDDPDTPTLTVSLMGQGIVPPNIEVEPSQTLAFGEIQVGNTTSYELIRVSNTGGNPLQLGTINVSGNNEEFIILDLCSNKTLRANKYCTVMIRFEPQATGEKTANLSISSNDPDMPNVDLALSGTAVGLCQGSYTQTFSSYPNSLDFGTELVGNSISLNMSVYYSAQGCNEIQIETIKSTGANAEEFVLEDFQCYNGSWSNNAYSSCWFKVTFTPTSAGNKAAELTTTFNDGSTGVWPKPQLQGIAVTDGEPNIEVSPSNHDFGNVTAGTYGSSQSFTVTNSGNVNLHIDAISITGSNNTDFYADSWQCLHDGLAPSQTCQIYSGFTPKSIGDKQANLTIASNDPDMLSLEVPLTGTAEEPVDCSDDNITIESSDNGVWATKVEHTNNNQYGEYWNYSEYTGDSEVWTRIKNPYSEGSVAPNRPTELDVVRIKAGHTITGIPYTTVRALCIEQNATLQSPEEDNTYPYLSVYATDTIENLGTIKGLNGADETASSSCTGTYWQAIGQPGCAQSGASVSLSVGYNLGTFRNEGTIVAGHGGDGQRYGASGGTVSINGASITNTDDIGYINAGRGGDITGTQSGQAGQGGGVFIWGNDYLMSDGRGIYAGNGGNCNANATEAQTGGNGGNMRLNASNTVDLLDGTFATGKGGKNCEPLGTNGRDGGFNTDPSILNLSGTNTKVEGGDITIFGGNDWTINLTNLGETALTATGDITIAVGPGGAIDMTGNTAKILKAAGKITVLADTILLDDGVLLSDIVEAAEIVRGPGQILRDVSVTAPNQVSGEPGTVVPITLTLSNGGPEKDTFLINLTDTAGWTLSDLATTVELEALETLQMTLNVTLPDTANTSNLISVTALSQSDPDAHATADIQVMVTEAVSGRASIDEGIVNLPGVETLVDGGDVTITAGENGTIDFSNAAGSQVITATGTITLAVGANGVLDLRGNNSTILETDGEVLIFADAANILLDPGVKLSDLIQASNIVVQASKPSYGISLNGPSEVSKQAGAILAINVTLTNTGVESDTYTISASDSAGWPLQLSPVSKIVKGLDSVELSLNAGLIASAGSTNTITVKATSQTDSSIVAITTVQVTVTDSPPSSSNDDDSDGDSDGDDDSDISDNNANVIVPPTSSLCRVTNGVINRLCRNDGQVITDVTIGTSASIAGGEVAGMITNDGLISQVTVQADTVLTGGKLTGYIVNNGTIADFEFVGAMVEGGTLSGTITNNSEVGGIFKNVRLAADTHIIGGVVQGEVAGDADAPAILENVTIKSGTQLSHVILSGSVVLDGFVTLTNVQLADNLSLSGGKLLGDIVGNEENPVRLENLSIRSGSNLSHVIIGDNVEFAEDVVLSQGVRFADRAFIPTKVELIGILPTVFMEDIDGITYPKSFDFSADVLESGEGLLAAINALPLFQDNGWEITQNSELGYFELTLDTVRYAVLPSSVKKLTTATMGMALQDALNVTFNTETGLAVSTLPALQAPTELQLALSKMGLTETLTIQANGNLQIPSENGLWYSARPDWLSTELANADVGETGVISFGESPYGGLLVSLIFDSGEASARQQLIYPAVAYPEALYSSATDVNMGAYGLVNFTLDGEAYRGIVDYAVTQEAQLTTEMLEVDIEATSDMNGDGIDDFMLNYSTGEQQILFALP